MVQHFFFTHQKWLVIIVLSAAPGTKTILKQCFQPVLFAEYSTADFFPTKKEIFSININSLLAS